MGTPASTPAEWIQSICHQFSQTTGWNLAFREGDRGPSAEPDRPDADPPGSCWLKEINDGDRTLGSLYLQQDGATIEDRSMRAITELADLLADLISELTTSNRTLESRTQEVNTLVDVSLFLSKEENLMLALRQLLQTLLQLTGFRASGFFLLNPRTDELTLRIAQDLDQQQIPLQRRLLSESMPDLISLARGKHFLFRDECPELSDWLPEGIAFGICLAVQSQVGPFGTLWAYDRRKRVPDQREMHVLESIAAQISAILERTVLMHESEDQHRLKQELRIISEAQPSDLQQYKLDHLPFEAAARSISSHEVGGDLCEIITINARQTVIAIGDASGDSIPAALVMSAVRGALHTLMPELSKTPQSSADLVARINHSLHNVTPAHQFMSFLLGILDHETLEFEYTNAGHPTPIWLHDGEFLSFESHGMLLGVLEEVEYTSSIIELSPGDLLVMFTDGISEAMSRGRQMFRSDGILGALQQCADKSALEILDTIWAQLEEHIAGGKDSDDRTLMALQVLEPIKPQE